MCNLGHTQCTRGVLDNSFLSCPGTNQSDVEMLPYVKFELTEIENERDGKENFKRTEKVITDLPKKEFIEKLTAEFEVFAEHIVAHWFLRNTKNTTFAPNYLPPGTLKITSDFGENIKIIQKWEVSEQYFKRPEVCLFGSVSGYMIPKLDDLGQAAASEECKTSHIVTSDYR